MKTGFEKTRKPWRGAAGGLLIRVAVVAGLASLSLPASADYGWIYSIQ